MTSQICLSVTYLTMPIFFESPACPTNCKECNVNDARKTKCIVNKCDDGHGLKDSDKTCIRMIHFICILSIHNHCNVL